MTKRRSLPDRIVLGFLFSIAAGMLGLAAGYKDAFGADLPTPSLTPGAVLPVTTEQVCAKGYAGKVRNVPSSEKRAVYREYGIAKRAPGEYEVDHLISLELGGSNELANLWPQSYRTSPWNAHVKDKLEDHLHALVCSGGTSLAEAQRAIATDWIGAYRLYFGNP